MKHRQLVVFSLDDRHYALRLDAVERVVPSLDVTPLPKAPEIVLGIVNMQGRIVPVLDVRSRFRLPPRLMGLHDHIIIAKTSKRTVALPVDSVSGAVDVLPEGVTEAKGILPGLDYLEGVARLPDGMLLIHDLERFLSIEEEKTLEEALKEKD